PHLIVQEPAQLRRQQRDGALRVLAGVEPVVVDPAHAPVRPQLGDRGMAEDAFEVLGHLLLALLGDEQLPEGTEAAPLVRTVDRVAFTQDLGDQVALAAAPGCDLFTYRSVERAEVLLYLPEVTQQVASEADELLELLAQLARLGDLDPAAADAFDLGV